MDYHLKEINKMLRTEEGRKELLKKYLSIEGQMLSPAELQKNLFHPMRLTAFKEVLKDREKGKPYKKKFSDFKTHFNKKIDLRLDQSIPPENLKLNRLREVMNIRETSLLQTIKEHPKGVFGVVVVGRNHVIDEAQSKLTHNKGNYIKSELAKFQDQNPYAVLDIKNK